MDASMDPVVRQAIAAVLSGKHVDNVVNSAYNVIYDAVCVRCRNSDEARAVCNLLVKMAAAEMDAVCATLAWNPDDAEGPLTFLRIFNWFEQSHAQLEKGIMATACNAWSDLGTSEKLHRELFSRVVVSANNVKVADSMARWLARALVIANTDLQQKLRCAEKVEANGALDACAELMTTSALPSDSIIRNADSTFGAFLHNVYEVFHQMFGDPWLQIRPHLEVYLSAVVAPADNFVYLTQLLQHALPQVRDRLRELAIALAVDPHVAALRHMFRCLVEVADVDRAFRCDGAGSDISARRLQADMTADVLRRIFDISAEYGSKIVQPVVAELLQAHSADARLDDLVATVDRLFLTHRSLGAGSFDLWSNVEAEVEQWLGGKEADSRAKKLAAYTVMCVTRSRPESWIIDDSFESFMNVEVSTTAKASQYVIIDSLCTLLQKASSQDLLGLELRRCLTIRLAMANTHDKITQIKETMTAFLRLCSTNMHWRRQLLELLTDTFYLSIKRGSNSTVTTDRGTDILLTDAASATDVQNVARLTELNDTRDSVVTGSMYLLVGNQIKWSLPILPLECSPLLTDFAEFKKVAANIYTRIHQKRKLLWQHAYSTATICLYDVRRLYAVVTLVQLAVLMVLDPYARDTGRDSASGASDTTRSAEEEYGAKRVRHDMASVAMACGYSEQYVADAVHDLRKVGLLDGWSVEYNFTCDRQTKPLNVAKLRPPIRAFAPSKSVRAVAADCTKERRFALECAIIKTMKTSRHIANITELEEKLAAEGALRFTVDADSIRTAVDSLASRDYIDTSDGSLRYIA